MVKNLRGLGILYEGGYEFLVMEGQEGDGFNQKYLPRECGGMFFTARKFPISEDRAEFRAPAWHTDLGGGFIRWFPQDRWFDVEFPDTDPITNYILSNL